LGVTVSDNAKALLTQANILLCVNEPNPKLREGLAPQSLIIGSIDDIPGSSLMRWALAEKISVFSMNLIPRLSRAQSMDTLSSQANLAGYRAVIEGVARYHRVIPMMMTAAGMIQPARVLVLGAGVAGLQAIATAKRLGAIVHAFDVRRASREQVESLGAEFIEVPLDEQGDTESGYATEMSDAYKKRQADLIDEYAQQSDIIISSALIPGRPAPLLIHGSTVEKMKQGSVIVDMAVSRGGNCELSKMDEVIQHKGVILVGLGNLPGLVPTTASELYANNLVHLLKVLVSGTPPQIQFDPEDQVIQDALLCQNGTYFPFKPVKESHYA
jgi:NAD(P) transhydrogenase subunit alpha